MRKTIFFIVLAMMFFAVEGYAQRQNVGKGKVSYQGSVSSSNFRVGSSSVSGSSSKVQHNGTTGQGSNFKMKQPGSVVGSHDGRKNPNRGNGGQSNRGGQQFNHAGSSYQSSQVGGRYQPSHTGKSRHGAGRHNHPRQDVANHHGNRFTHGHKCHQYSCLFDAWVWVNYLGYTKRFISHVNTVDNYFDTMLGYYIYGSLQRPSMISLSNFSLRRDKDILYVFNSGHYSFYNFYQPAHLIYYAGYRTIEVIIADGHATVKIYDDWGNSATYCM